MYRDDKQHPTSVTRPSNTQDQDENTAKTAKIVERLIEGSVCDGAEEAR